ncbi:MAG TPA: hypothetical protein VKY57_07600 [Chitinispirillaceae bacterium]|nr:hypothetical protein [Chitinispirillaceae bacterium]
MRGHSCTIPNAPGCNDPFNWALLILFVSKMYTITRYPGLSCNGYALKRNGNLPFFPPQVRSACVEKVEWDITVLLLLKSL